MRMQQLQIPNIPVPFSIVVLVHFFFASNAFLTSDFYDWIPSYLFTHVVVILIGLWASRDRNSFEPIIAYIIAVAISILNDIILLGIYFSDAQERADNYVDHTYRDTWRYSAGYPCLHNLLPLFVDVLFFIIHTFTLAASLIYEL